MKFNQDFVGELIAKLFAVAMFGEFSIGVYLAFIA